MTTDATLLLRELREDHRNMAILLDLLQQETGHVSGDDEADFELLHDIMRYMTVYSDAIHHPREDLIYAGLLAVQPKLGKGLERVEAEHEEIAELGLKLRSDIEAAISGAAIERQRILEDASNYMHRLRQHMAWEEEDLFRRADAEGDVLAIDASHLVASDPVFGERREASFANLLKSIQSGSEIPG